MRSETPTREEFVTKHVPSVMQECATVIQSKEKSSVVELLEELLPTFGFNHHFLWTEVLIDVAYQYPQHIDLYKEFPIGPGSMPSMKRIAPKSSPVQTARALSQANFKDLPLLAIDRDPISLSAENWEGIGCEFRKYANLSKGKGRKRKYK